MNQPEHTLKANNIQLTTRIYKKYCVLHIHIYALHKTLEEEVYYIICSFNDNY